MPSGTYLHYLIQFFDTLKDVILGGFGGVVAYMYDYTKHKRNNHAIPWSSSAMAINAFLGGFTANALGSFIPTTLDGRDGLIGFIGVSSYAILGIVESKFAKVILSKTLGVGNEKS